MVFKGIALESRLKDSLLTFEDDRFSGRYLIVWTEPKGIASESGLSNCLLTGGWEKWAAGGEFCVPLISGCNVVFTRRLTYLHHSASSIPKFVEDICRRRIQGFSGGGVNQKWDGNILWSLLANKYWLYFNASFWFTVVRFVNQQVVFSPPLWRDVTVFRDITFSVRIRCSRFTESSLSWSVKRWARTETQGTQGTLHTIASLNARLPVGRVWIKQTEKWIIKLKRTRKTSSEFCHSYCGVKGGKTNMAVQYHLSENRWWMEGHVSCLSVCASVCLSYSFLPIVVWEYSVCPLLDWNVGSGIPPDQNCLDFMGFSGNLTKY